MERGCHVQPLFLEKETTMLFINTLKSPFITHMIRSTTKSFVDMVMEGEMIENAIRGGKIEGETAKRSAQKRKDNEVNNTSSYNSKVITVSQPRATTVGQQDSQKQRSGSRQNSEKVSFTPIPMMYREHYQSLFNTHAITPFHLKPLQPPYPKWYDANAKCKYYAGISRHSIKNCIGFKKAVERLIKMRVVKFDDTPSIENPLPNHGDQGVNAIGDTGMRRIKEDVDEVRMPMKVIWEEMVKREMIIFEEGNKGARDYCEFHAEKGHEIQECDEFKALVQSLMNNKELKFYEACPDEGHNYDCNVTIPEREDIVSTSKEAQVEGSYTRTGKRYDTNGIRVEPTKVKAFDVEKENRAEVLVNESVKEEEAREFLKFLKHSEYSVVKQLRKQPARILVLALLLSSEVHREALIKVLNETYVTNNISVNKLDQLVSNVSADNFIYFNDDEIPPSGMGSAKALHITTRCKGYTLPSVLIDNVRAFDGTERNVMGRIDIPLLIGPNVYEVDFLVMNIKPSYNFLLGSPWIHSAGAVPSSLHQKLKLVTDGRLVTINVKEGIIATVASNAPYVEANEEAVECSFRSLEFVNTTFILEGNEVTVPRISRTTRMGLQITVGKGALPGKELGRYLQRGIQVLELREKRDRFGLGFKPDQKQRRNEIENHQERRRAHLSGREVEWELMTFPHISQTFISGGIIHPERGMLEKGNYHINAVHNEESLDINDMSTDTTNPEFSFEQDMCLEEPQNFEDDRDCDVSPDLLRMIWRLYIDRGQIKDDRFGVSVLAGMQIKDINMASLSLQGAKRRP
ncbi:uncharacterized protein [Gossypium hirsutum]|uniref:Gag-pro-like protein n=1 Tax=Gossypium hirsutum TaxID=3635 RepID=A0ABM3BWD9_GOSHI|nr:uncharacterized protein LOC121230540 [Gossypium hirsutum]